MQYIHIYYTYPYVGFKYNYLIASINKNPINSVTLYRLYQVESKK